MNECNRIDMRMRLSYAAWRSARRARKKAAFFDCYGKPSGGA